RKFEKMTMAAMKRALAAAAVLLAATLVVGSQEAKPELSRGRLAVGGQPALFYPPPAGAGGVRAPPAAPRAAEGFLFPCRRRAGAAGLDRRQRRRGDRRVRSHHPDAGEEPADRRRGAARGVPRLRARGVDEEGAGLPLARRPQGPEDRRDRARLEHAVHGA